MVHGVVTLSALPPLSQLQVIASLQVRGGLRVFAPPIEHLGKTEVQQQLLRVGQVSLVQQAAERGQVRFGQPAAEEFRQLVMGESEAGVTRHRGT